MILENLKDKSLLLASGSPRRRELLSMLDVHFDVVRLHDVDESYPDTLPPEDVAPYLARVKADAYRHDISDNAVAITADTVVICAGEVIGKPRDESDARRMLRTLAGRTHKVVTGVCVFTTTRTEQFSATTEVTFAPLTDDEIDYYVELYRPLDKAGAYGIQELIGVIAVQSIRGSFYNVMGLPMHSLYQTLKTF